MAKLSEAALKKLIKNGETNFVELKRGIPRPKEIAERLCGLANAHGGFIIFGVEDGTLDIVGIPQENRCHTECCVTPQSRNARKRGLEWL